MTSFLHIVECAALIPASMLLSRGALCQDCLSTICEFTHDSLSLLGNHSTFTGFFL